jgi:uncharacterized membrane protein YjdF
MLRILTNTPTWRIWKKKPWLQSELILIINSIIASSWFNLIDKLINQQIQIIVVANSITVSKSSNDLQMSSKFPIAFPSTHEVVGNTFQFHNVPFNWRLKLTKRITTQICHIWLTFALCDIPFHFLLLLHTMLSCLVSS